MHFFEKKIPEGFKSRFDRLGTIDLDALVLLVSLLLKRCFLRRVMVMLLQQKNFGPNVIYFALGITEARRAMVHSKLFMGCKTSLTTSVIVIKHRSLVFINMVRTFLHETF